MRKILLILACAAVFAGAYGQKLEPRRTVIAGVVENYSDDKNVIVLNYCDPLSIRERHTHKLDESDGAFHTEHDYAFAQNITMRIGWEWINLFVSPGDSLFIRIDASDMSTEFSGDGAERNRELNDWLDYVDYKDMNFNTDAPSDEFQAELRADFAKARKHIDKYVARTGMSDFIREWAYIDHVFAAANQIMSYRGEDAWEVFTGPLFDVFNPANMQTMMFPYHLQACVGSLYGNDARFIRMLQANELAEFIRAVIDKLHEKAPEGVVRDMMLYVFLKQGLSRNPELYAEVPEIATAFSDPLFDERLRAMAEDLTRPLSLEGVPLKGVSYLAGDVIEGLPEVDLLKCLREKYEGKVLYIDVWATWCGPCLNEMKKAPDLHRYFEGQDVVFVNLCAQSEPETWIPTIERHSVHGENYFLDYVATDLFMGAYNLSGYPSYMIVDRDGTLHTDAPRPTHLHDATQKLEELLK